MRKRERERGARESVSKRERDRLIMSVDSCMTSTHQHTSTHPCHGQYGVYSFMERVHEREREMEREREWARDRETDSLT